MIDYGLLLVAPCVLGPFFLFVILMLMPDPVEPDPHDRLTGEYRKSKFVRVTNPLRVSQMLRKLPVYQKIRDLRRNLTPGILYSPFESINESLNIMGKEMDKSKDSKTPYPEVSTFEQEGDVVCNIGLKENNPDSGIYRIMSSSSYWGLDTNSNMLDHINEKLREAGTINHGSSYLMGDNHLLTKASRDLAKFYGRKYCTLTTSGTLACMGLVEHLCCSGSVIFIDSKSHGSFIQGAHLAHVKVKRYPSGKYGILKNLIKNWRKSDSDSPALLIVDGVNNITGAVANLELLYKMCTKYDVKLVLDETHSLGTLGAKGRGLESLFNMNGKAHYICGSLSGSLATTGGFIVSDDVLIDFMFLSDLAGRISSPSNFTAACVSKGLSVITEDDGRCILRFKDLKHEWINQLKEIHSDDIDWVTVRAAGNCIMVIYNDSTCALEVARELKSHGYITTSLVYPYTNSGTSALRLTVTTKTTMESMSQFCSAYKSVMGELFTCSECSQDSGKLSNSGGTEELGESSESPGSAVISPEIDEDLSSEEGLSEEEFLKHVY